MPVPITEASCPQAGCGSLPVVYSRFCLGLELPELEDDVTSALSTSILAASAQSKSGFDKLYILNCGEGVAGDISRWSPGVNVGKPMDFVDNCYVMHNTQGWLLWDAGITDAIAAMPDGQAPEDPRRHTVTGVSFVAPPYAEFGTELPDPRLTVKILGVA